MAETWNRAVDLWTCKQGARPFSHTLLCVLLHKLQWPLRPCLPTLPALFLVAAAPRGRLKLLQVLLTAPMLHQPLSCFPFVQDNEIMSTSLFMYKVGNNTL